MWTTRYTTRAPALVVDEIEEYVRRYRVENIDFYDLTSIVERDWILEFCRLLDARGLRITWQLPSGTRSEALDEPVLRAMYRSGCRNVSYAPESGSRAHPRRDQEEGEARPPRGLDAHRGACRAQREGEHPDRLSRRADATTCARRCASSCAWRASACTTCRCGPSRPTRARSCSSSCAPPAACRASTTTTTPRCSPTPTSPAPCPTPRRSTRRSCSATASPACCCSTARATCTHPARPLRSLYNIATRRYESRLEMSFGNLVRRLSTARARRARGGVSARHLRHLRSRAPRHRGAVGVGAPGRPRAGAGVRGAAVLVGQRHRLGAAGAPARPAPEETAERVVATRPDVVAFTSYSVTHRWADRRRAGGEARAARCRSSSAARTCRRRRSGRSASGRSTRSSRARARARWST